MTPGPGRIRPIDDRRAMTIGSPGPGHGAITGMIIVTELSGVTSGVERGPGTDHRQGPRRATSSDPDCDELLTL